MHSSIRNVLTSGRGICGMLLAACQLACSSEPSPPATPSLVGTWIETATDFPELRDGAARCYEFRLDGTYVLEDRKASASAVPLYVHRWTGHYTLTGDTLTRAIEHDQLYSGYTGTLQLYSEDSTSGNSWSQEVHFDSDSLVVKTVYWVQDIGARPTIDVNRRAYTQCGAEALP